MKIKWDNVCKVLTMVPDSGSALLEKLVSFLLSFEGQMKKGLRMWI